jgi:uncharacterized protein (TIGR02466 family)
MDFTDIRRDVMFPVYLYSFEPKIDLETFKTELYALKDKTPESVKISNRGGWQSPETDVRFDEKTVISSLCAQTLSFIEKVIHPLENIYLPGNRATWWASFNDLYSSNVPHDHVDAGLSCIFYVSVPPDSGDLIFIRNGDNGAVVYGNHHRYFRVSPQEGRMFVFPSHLLHFVEPSLSTDTRISVSINFYK